MTEPMTPLSQLPHRKFWMAARTPLTMVLLLLLVVVAGAWGYRQATTPIPKRPPTPCVTQSVGPALTPANTTVQVFNGTTQSGLAKRVRLLLSAEGFRVTKSVNADQPAEKTYIVGYDEKNPEVVLLRSYFDQGVPFVADTTKVDHTVDVVLGPDFKALVAGLKSVPLKDGTACLPKPTPLPTSGG